MTSLPLLVGSRYADAIKIRPEVAVANVQGLKANRENPHWWLVNNSLPFDAGKRMVMHINGHRVKGEQSREICRREQRKEGSGFQLVRWPVTDGQLWRSSLKHYSEAEINQCHSGQFHSWLSLEGVHNPNPEMNGQAFLPFLKDGQGAIKEVPSRAA